MDVDKLNSEVAEVAGQQLAKGGTLEERFRHQALKRGCAGIKTIGRSFRIMDNDGSKRLQPAEFIQGCRDWGITMTNPELKQLFAKFDKDGSGAVDYEEFLAAVRQPMNNARTKLIEKTFNDILKKCRTRKTDGAAEPPQQQQPPPQQQQQQQLRQRQIWTPEPEDSVPEEYAITIEDLARCYKVHEHPKYKNGEMTQREVLQQFLNNFQPGSQEKDDKITLQEFTDYYAAISLSIDNDAVFSFIVNKAWGVNPHD